MILATRTCRMLDLLAVCAVGRQALFESRPAIKAALFGGFFQTASILCIFMSLILVFQPVHLLHAATGYGWAALGCLALTFGTIALIYGVALLGSYSFSMIIKLEPIFTALFAVLLIGETLNSGQYAGIALIMISLIVFQ